MKLPSMALTKPLLYQASALTDQGQERERNEDAVFQFTELTEDGASIGLYMVCDGMGGHEAGHLASQLAVQTIVAAFGDLIVDEESKAYPALAVPVTPRLFAGWLRQAIKEANEKIRQVTAQSPMHKMGTTVTAVLLYNEQATIGHVGDSRAYLWRRGNLKQVTTDHTLVSEMVREGLITPAEARVHPRRNILTAAVGSAEALERIDIYEQTVQPGDRLLLCSDGLWQAYPEGAELAAQVAQFKEPGSLCWHLVAKANQRDGSDNISVVVVDIGNKERW